MAADEKKMTVAYVPFKTFLAAIEGFERHMPAQIDSSVWPTYSGAMKSQLLGSFKFLGLIDEHGHPTNALKSLVEDKANRKATIRKILEASYKPLVNAGLQHMTPRMFDDLMSAYGMTGATHKKVLSFFIKAAKFSELPMSPLLMRKIRTTGPRKRKSADSPESEYVFQTRPETLTQGSSRTIDLKSGGKLTLMLTVNVFDLNGQDREFVFGIIDKLQGYEGQKEKSAKE
jgi:hypothetical protein